MGHAERFLEHVRSESIQIDDDAIFNSIGSAEEAETLLFAFGQYVLDCARSLDPELSAYPSTVIDYGELKDHYLQFISEYQIGGRKYPVVLDETQYLRGKLADDSIDFHNATVAQIRSVVKNYRHVQNHIKPDLIDYCIGPTDRWLDDYTTSA